MSAQTTPLGVIVEGHGEEKAVPVLLKRLAKVTNPSVNLKVEVTRLARGKILQEAELRRHIKLLAGRLGAGGRLLVLFDADDDCPVVLARRVDPWVGMERGDLPRGVVLAKREFEAWFLAAARSLRGCEGLPQDLEPPPLPEGIRNAKGWLEDRMPYKYSETIHQPAFCKLMDLEQARGAPSFEKLRRDLARLLAPP